MKVSGGSNSVVECDLAKVEVAGSNPVSRSRFSRPRFLRGFFVWAQRKGVVPSGKAEVRKPSIGGSIPPRASSPTGFVHHAHRATAWKRSPISSRYRASTRKNTRHRSSGYVNLHLARRTIEGRADVLFCASHRWKANYIVRVTSITARAAAKRDHRVVG